MSVLWRSERFKGLPPSPGGVRPPFVDGFSAEPPRVRPHINVLVGGFKPSVAPAAGGRYGPSPIRRLDLTRSGQLGSAGVQGRREGRELTCVRTRTPWLPTRSAPCS